jgi:hypothetical protein
MLQFSANSKQTTQSVLVLCTHRMRKIYRLLESLLKSYITPNISILYITLDEIKPFVMKHEQTSDEIIQKDTPLSTEKNVSNSNISNEEFLHDYLRVASRVLIFMKHLNESYLTAVCPTYSSICLSLCTM